MKYFLITLLLGFVLVSCIKKEEPKFSSYGTQAFAYSLDTGWEVNGLTRVKDFKNVGGNDQYSASISYAVLIVNPENDTLKAVSDTTVSKTNQEKMNDTEIDTQFDLDSTYTKGKYKLIFHLKDANSGQTASSSASFTLD